MNTIYNPVIVSKVCGTLMQYYPLKDHDRSNRLFLLEFTTHYKLFRDVD